MLADHFDTLERVHEQRFEPTHGPLRRAARQAAGRFLDDIVCGPQEDEVFYSRGDGSFETHHGPVDPGAPIAWPQSFLSLLDMNHDGFLDLVQSIFGEDATIAGSRTFRGLGNDGFAFAHTQPVNGPWVFGNVDGDSIEDAIVLGRQWQSIRSPSHVMRGLGDLRFELLDSLAVDVNDGAMADFDDNGTVELVMSGLHLRILEIHPDGSPVASQSFTRIGLPPGPGACIDTNRLPDLVAAWNDSLWVSLASGHDGYDAPISSYAGVRRYYDKPIQLASADLNEDASPDAIVTYGSFVLPSGPRPLPELLGNGDGTFRLNESHTGEQSFMHVAVGDVNGDQHADVLGVSQYSNALRVFLGNGLGGVAAECTTAVGWSAQDALHLADFDGDGRVDVIGEVGMLRGTGDCRFDPHLVLDSWSYTYDPTREDYSRNHVVDADLNRDGIMDLVVQKDSTTATLTTWLGNGDGTFARAYETLGSGWSISPSLAVGDLDNDHIPDVVVQNEFAQIFLGRGDGTLVPLQLEQLGRGFLQLADVNQDHRLDLVSPTIVLLNQGTESEPALEVRWLTEFPDTLIGRSELHLEWATIAGRGETTVEIRLSHSGRFGSFADLVASQLPSSGSWSWHVPAPTDTQLFLQVIARDSSGRVDAATTRRLVFGPRRPPQIRVLPTSTGDSLRLGEEVTLRWAASDDDSVTTIDIEWSASGVGGPFHPLFTGLSNSGSQSWVVTSPVTADGRLRFVAHDNMGLVAEALSPALAVVSPRQPTPPRLVFFQAFPDTHGVRIVWLLMKGDPPVRELPIERSNDGGASWVVVAGTPEALASGFWQIRDAAIAPDSTYLYRLRAIDDEGHFIDFTPISVRLPATPPPPTPPSTYSMRFFGTNPTREPITMEYALPERGRVDLCVVDVSGRFVETLFRGTRDPGYFRVTWAPQARLRAGIYFVSLEAGSRWIVRRVAFVP